MIDNLRQPLISVVVPCFNHGKYLPTAIGSVLSQSYKHYEIIVIDDGSTDDTKIVAEKYQGVIYVYQQNQGLSAARNTGISKSTGSFLVFLDADDWLVPGALKTNLSYFDKAPAIPFVSGAHEILYESDNKSCWIQMDTNENPYYQLLEKNYIGMHAAVMFQRWVFDLYRYDTDLRSCEDYDLYLKIVRHYPVISHNKVIAVYRFHENNMSGNHLQMLESALRVLKKQESLLVNETEQQWYQKGLVFWKAFYSEKMYHKLVLLLYKGYNLNPLEIDALQQYNEALYQRFLQIRRFAFITRPLKNMKTSLKRLLPASLVRKLQKNFVPAPGKVVLGDFNRTQPFSEQFGYDRGGPVDRYYIEKFLEKNAAAISGRVMEIGDNEYTLRFGGTNVLQSDILHIDESNTKATFIGDLSNAPHVPNNSFDCIVLTQTLHLIYEYKSAIETCYRILKPGGTLLMTVPGISHIAQDEWGKYWLWSFTDNAINRILSEVFPSDQIGVQTFGNVLVATAFLYGMGLPELNKEQLDTMDPHYQVIITACAVK